MGEFLSFVTIDVWTMIFTWANLLILFLIMKKFLFKPIRNIIEKRQEEIESSLAEAENAKNEAYSMKDEYTKKLEDAKDTAEEIVKNATKTAQLREEDILKEAQKKATQLLERADKQIEEKKKAALSDIKNEVSDIATSIATKIIERDIDKKDHERLIEDFINEMGNS